MRGHRKDKKRGLEEGDKAVLIKQWTEKRRVITRES